MISNRTFKRVLLGFGVGCGSLIIIVVFGIFLASLSVTQSTFISINIILPLVCFAIFIADRIFVTRNKL